MYQKVKDRVREKSVISTSINVVSMEPEVLVHIDET